METTVRRASSSPQGEDIKQKYKIGPLLAPGGMGDVYLAEQLHVGRRHVALKVLNNSNSTDPESIKRFRYEAATAGKLDHENIVKIYDCSVTNSGQVYVAMEYVNGKNLNQVIESQGPLPFDIIVEITKQICAGLNVAHKAGIVHRDIKSDNIMLAKIDDGIIVKILDFGIAKFVGNEDTLTSEGTILGSASYMSPEQAEGKTGEDIDARADIYALGMVVYKMLTGRVAFKDPLWDNLLYKQIKEIPVSPKSIRPDTPDSIARVVLKALEKDKHKRQQSALQFAAELESAYKDEHNSEVRTSSIRRFTISLSSPIPDSSGSTSKPVRRKPWKYFILPLLVGLVGSIIFFYLAYLLPKPDTEKAPPPSVSVHLAEYRINLKEPNGELDTLPDDNRIKSGNSIWLQFRVDRTGTLYLLHDNDDGSMYWVNCVDRNQPQIAKGGQWLRIPEDPNDTILVAGSPGTEKFLILFVPFGNAWSLLDAVLPQSLLRKNRF
jgi:serine/threonine protein kinase